MKTMVGKANYGEKEEEKKDLEKRNDRRSIRVLRVKHSFFLLSFPIVIG